MFFNIRLCENKGRGLFAKKRYAKDEVIERAPVIVIPAGEEKLIEETVLYNYTYAWGESSQDSAICLGYGSLCNHSYRPNAFYVRNYETMTMNFIALREIEEGEEITVNYNGDPSDTSPLWFEVAEEPVKTNGKQHS